MDPSGYVMRLKIELLGVAPVIWREIDVPGSYSFWDLHVAIQDAMGWSDSHLHVFHVLNTDLSIGLPDMEFTSNTTAGWKVPIHEYLNHGLPLASYEYDFGDSWIHEVRLVDYLEPENHAEYPRCVAGANSCPPEDCGGPPGFARFLEAIGDSAHPEHKAMLEWVGGAYDPSAFRPEEVQFEDPQTRLRSLLSNE